MLTLFNSLRKEISINTGELTPLSRMLCPTYWSVRHASIIIILSYSIIQSSLEEIRQGHNKYAAKASRMVSKMDDFNIFWLQTCLPFAEQLSINIQTKDITVQEAVHGVQLLITYLCMFHEK